jgi:hypothetical protein
MKATWLGIAGSCKRRPPRRATSKAMTHIVIQEALDGKAVDWMEKVSDEQYRARSVSNL